MISTRKILAAAAGIFNHMPRPILRWLDQLESADVSFPPLRILLCAGKNSEPIELLELDRAGIHVAEYLTVLPPKDVLHKRLQSTLIAAHERLVRDDAPNLCIEVVKKRDRK